MRWGAFQLLLAFGASAVFAQDEEVVPHLRGDSENEMTNARRKIFSIFATGDGYKPHDVAEARGGYGYYKRGYYKIDDRGTKYCSKKKPCGECQGDCDSDSDCDDGLYCYHRSPYKSVPGCSGGSKAKSKTDFCVKKKRHSSPSKKKKQHSSPSKKKKQHSSPSKKKQHHSSSSDDASGKIRDKGSDYCTKREPCGECYGDCDSDKDCKKGLYCYHRKPYQSVPGCSGASKAKSKTDFCVKKKYHKPSYSHKKKKSYSYSHKKKYPSYTHKKSYSHKRKYSYPYKKKRMGYYHE